MTTTAVNKFHKSKIYKIYSDLPELSGKCYVGSTSQSLSQRMGKHRTASKDVNKKRTLYVLMRKYGVQNFKILLIENVRCEDRDELHLKENQHITALDCVVNGWNCLYSVLNIEKRKENKKIYYHTNKDAIKKQVNQYYQSNKDAIKQYNIQRYQSKKGTFKCETCNTTSNSNSDLTKHYKSKKHIDNLTNQTNQTTDTTTTTPINFNKYR